MTKAKPSVNGLSFHLIGSILLMAYSIRLALFILIANFYLNEKKKKNTIKRQGVCVVSQRRRVITHVSAE